MSESDQLEGESKDSLDSYSLVANVDKMLIKARKLVRYFRKSPVRNGVFQDFVKIIKSVLLMLSS